MLRYLVIKNSHKYMNTIVKFSDTLFILVQKIFILISYVYRLLWKKRALVLSAFLVMSQLLSPVAIIVAYAAPTASNQVGSSGSLDPVGNKVTRLQTQGSSGVDQSSGALTYSYPLTIPEGRAGMAPKLSLSYNSQNNDSGWFGYGWNMGIPYIERTSKTGSDKMYSNQAFVSSLHGELISSNGVSFEQKIDDGSYAKYTYSGNTWQMTDRDGITYYFGNTYYSRTQDDSGSKIGRWYISEVRDKFGNGITYTYTKDNGTVYPSTISYTEHALAHPLNFITFNLENKNDKTISYKYGFRTVDSKRVSYVKVITNGKDNTYFTFNYTTGSNGVRSLLDFVEEKHLGTNGDWTTLPKTSFEYEKSAVSFSGTITNTVNPYGTNNVVIDTNNDGFLDVYNAGDGYFPVDINGDYKKDLVQSDIIYGANGPYINFKYNQGGSFILRTLSSASSLSYVRYMVQGMAIPPLRYIGDGQWWYTQESSITDVNGDGFDDVVYNDPYGGTGVAVNTTKDTFDYSSPSDLGFNVSNDQVVDVNGDGLQDKISKSNTSTSTLFNVYLNNGSRYSTSSDFLYDAKIPTTGYDIGVRFIDVNNDGLIDVVRSYFSNYVTSGMSMCTSGQVTTSNPPTNQNINEILINTGSSFVLSSSTFSGYVISHSACRDGYNNPFLLTQNTKEYDVNGDLTTDYDGSTNNTAKQDVLKKITGSLGSTLDISYTWSTKTGLNPNLSVPMHIVATTTDKLSASDTNPHSVGYNFSDGQMYFDANNPRDHKFAGFGKVEVIDGKNKTVNYYHQGNGDSSVYGEKGDSYYNTGRSYRTDVFDLSLGTSTLVTKNLLLYTTYAYASSSFTYLDSQVSSTYDQNGSFLSSGTKNIYDPAKRLIKTSYSYGDIEPFTSFASSTVADKGTDYILTEYQYSNTRPQRLVKEVSTDYAGNTVSNNSYYYDNLPFGLVDKGAVTSVAGIVYTSTGSVSSTSTTQTMYDSTGNVVRTTDNLNNSTKFVYDNSYSFPVAKIDAKNGTTTFSYDPYTLNLLTTKGSDGITYAKETDGLGKVVRAYTLSVTGGIIDDTRTSYVYGGGLSVYSRKNADSATSARSLQVYDSYGRLIQSKNETTPDIFHTQDTKYDSQSNIISSSLPYTTTGYGFTNDTPTNGSVIYGYDGLGRVTTKESFGTRFSYQYGARNLTVFDNASTQHKKFYAYDARGNLSQVNENNGSITYTTKYNYTPFNKISRIVDANGNIRNFSYLSNGSLVYQEDPHPSSDTTFTTYSYAYDSLGNLITKTGPLGTLTYTYDSLGRPLARTLLDSSYGTSTVSIGYDGCSNNYLSPCIINRSTSSTTLSYDVAGRLNSESLLIDGNSFVRSYAYDLFGNPNTITYPDNGKTVYTYTLDGKQSSLSYITPSGTTKKIVSNSTYNSLGALSSLSFGNGVEMCNTYTNTSVDGTISPKLAKSAYLFNTTGCASSPNQIELYKDEFTYKDNLTPSAILSTYKDIAGVTHTKNDSFTYDNLARLTQVSTSYDAATSVNSTFVYDPIGNILKENDVLYRYSQDGPQNAHAATSIGGSHITYDEQGNRIQVGDNAYAWNALNQMVSATTTNGMEFYTYDENGERIKKVIRVSSVVSQKVTPATATSSLSSFKEGDLLAQVATSSTYISTSTHATLTSLALLDKQVLTTLVGNFYASPFVSKFCAAATSSANRKSCIATTTMQLLANNINSRGTSTVATNGLITDILNIVTGTYLIPTSYTGIATSSVAVSDGTTFSINAGTISSYNTYVSTGIVVPMAEYSNLPHVSTSTYTSLVSVGLTDTSKVRALLTLAGCSSVMSPCSTAEKVVFEKFYKENGYLFSDKVLQEMWYVFAAKARLPGNGAELTSTSTVLGAISVPEISGRSVSSATSTYYSSLYFVSEYTNQNNSEPRLKFFNTVPYFISQAAFTELEQSGITQMTIESYNALIEDLLGIKAASSTEYITALSSFAFYDKKVTLSQNTLKELYLVTLGAASVPNNIDEYSSNAIFDISSYISATSYLNNGYVTTWDYYSPSCISTLVYPGGTTSKVRCLMSTSPFTLPASSSSTFKYVLTLAPPMQAGANPLVIGKTSNIVNGLNEQYSSITVASDGSKFDVDVTSVGALWQSGSSTPKILIINSSEYTSGTVGSWQATSIGLKVYVNTPRLTVASTTLVSTVSNATSSSFTSGIQSTISAYFGEISDSSNNYVTASSTATSLMIISPESYNEFASTTLKDSYAISKVFLATSTPWCASNASTTECDKQVRKIFFRTTIGNLSGFVPSEAAVEEFWMVHKGLLALPDIKFASTTVITNKAGYWKTVDASSSLPSGGVVSTSTIGYRIHTFSTSSTFVSPFIFDVEVMVVGGGGNGGAGNSSRAGGGGGAGQVSTSSAYSVTSSPITVTVGSATQSSSFGSITALAGSNGNLASSGGNSGNGYVGGTTGNDNSQASGGGAGSSGNGNPNVGGTPGNGGTGYTSSISGTSTCYAGGGGGASASAGLGVCGGGNGGAMYYVGSNAVSNSGGGGGGSSYYATSNSTGGSGIVIVRYPILISGSSTQLYVGSATTTSYVILATSTYSPLVFSRSSLSSSLSTTTSILTATGTIPGYYDAPVYHASSTTSTTTYATLNPLDKSSDLTLSNGNLTVTAGGSGYDTVRSTIGTSTGKWYWEWKYTTVASADAMVGFAKSTASLNNYVGIDDKAWGNYMPTGNKLFNTGNTAYGSSQAVNDTVMLALDLDNGKVYWGKNGTWFNSGNPASGTNPAYTGVSGTVYAGFSLTNPNVTAGTVNFGQTAFTYSVPSGFNAGLFDTVTSTSTTGYYDAPVYHATTTALLPVTHLDLVPPGLLTDTQFNSLYSTSTFAQATTTYIVSQSAYNELLYTPLRLNSDVKTIFDYVLPSATSTCSGQSATSTCVKEQQKVQVKTLVGYYSGFLVSSSTLEELAKVYRGELSIMSPDMNALVYATNSIPVMQTIALPLDSSKIFTTFSTSTNATTTVSSSKGICSTGITGATTSDCYIELPHLNSGVASLSFNFDIATTTASTSTLLSTLTYLVPNATSTTGTSTPTFTTVSTTTMIAGVRSSNTFTFNVGSLYQSYLGLPNTPVLTLTPTATSTNASSTYFVLSNPGLTATRSVVVPQVTYDHLLQSIAFDRNSLGMSTSTGTTTIDLSLLPSLTLSSLYLAPAGVIVVSASTTATTTLSSSVLAYWPLTSTSTDLTTNHNGNASNVTYSTSCGFASTSVCYNGSNSAIYVPNGISLANTNWTVNAKVYPGVLYDHKAILSRSNGLSWAGTSYVFTLNGDKMFVQLGNNGSSGGTSFTGTYSLSTNNVYDLRWTYDGSNVRMYVNGSLKDTFAITNMNLNNVSNTYIGATDNITYFYNGGIKDLFVLNIASSTATGLDVGGVTTNGSVYLPYGDTPISLVYQAPPVIPQTVLPIDYFYPFIGTSTVSTSTIFSLTTSTSSIYTTYSPFGSSYIEDSRGTRTIYFTFNGALVGAYTYQVGNEAVTGKISYAHTNYLGTPVIETDDKGDIVQMDITDVFGNYVMRDQRNDNAYHNKGYTSHEFDDVTGLNYAHARYLSAPMHSFMSVDPMLYSLPQSYLLDPQQMNSYAYARNNPVIYNDPTGEITLQSAIGFVTGAVTNFVKSGNQLLGSYVSYFSNPISFISQTYQSTQSAVNKVISAGITSSIKTGVSSAQSSLSSAYNTATFSQGYSAGTGPAGTIVTTGVTIAASGVAGLARGGVVASEELAPAVASKSMPQVLINQMTGNAFRDNVADFMSSQGRVVEKEVMKKTPFGRRFIDVEVSDTDGNVLGGIETKTGGARYAPSQRAKDMYLKLFSKYIVNVVRDQE